MIAKSRFPLPNLIHTVSRRPTTSFVLLTVGLIALAILGPKYWTVAGETSIDAQGTENQGTENQGTIETVSELSNNALPVRVVHVGDLQPPQLDRVYAGQLMATMESSLGFERTGRVDAIHVAEGDAVTAGQVLATLAVDDLDAAEKRTLGELDSANALLAELVAGPRQQTIDAAEARVAQLAAQVELAKSNTQREEQLARRGAGSDRTLDAARFGRESITQQLRSAKAEYELLVEGTRAEQITAQRGVCESIAGRLSEIQSQRNDSEIVAPFDGQISVRHVDPGTVTQTGQPILHLISNQIEGRFGVPPDVARGLAVGNSVRISVGGESDSGAIIRLDPMLDLSTRTRGVHVQSDSTTASSWVAGEVAKLHLQMPTANSDQEQSFWLPNSAMIRGGRGLWTLLVVPGDDPVGECERRAVEVLQTEGDFSLVQGMVVQGERVIVDGMHRLTAGMRVEVTQPFLQSSSETSE